MRWRGRRESTRVEDRRGLSGRQIAGGGLGCGGVVIILLFLLLGGDPQQLSEVLEQASRSADVAQAPAGSPGSSPEAAPDDELGRFASVVLADTEDTWRDLFSRMGRSYRLPTLVLFTDSVSSACGFNTAAVGPFYCPADEKIYLDLGFFDTLERRLGAPGDFAQAYVIAHEVGHHVQNVLGISADVERQRRRSSQRQANQLSVRLELQADCLAGVWAHHAHRQRNLLEPGDVEEGLRAAGSIGDDVMQRRAGGTIRPETWTHGSSSERQRWLRRGLETGDPSACDTF